MSNIQVNSHCKFLTSTTDAISSDDYDNGRVSDFIYDNYENWTDLNGEEVLIMALHNGKNQYGCKEPLAKVYLKDEGLDWWFTVKVSDLHLLNAARVTGKMVCSCPLTIIVNRGCQCGGI